MPDTTPSEANPRQPSPEASSNFLSRIFFLWVIPILRVGYRKPLQDADLWELRSFEGAQHTTAILTEKWILQSTSTVSSTTETGKKNKAGKNRLLSAIIATHRSPLLISGLLRFIDVILYIIQPIFINRFIVFLQDETQPVRTGYLWGLALFLTVFVKAVSEATFFSIAMRTGMRVRSGLQGMLYDKSLTLSPSARASESLGEIVNLMQLDSQRIGDSIQIIQVLWSAPVQILVSIGLLYNYIGVSAIIGFLFTVVSVPAQGLLITKQIRLRVRTLIITDKRVKLMNEILQGIKAVKFYAWEKPFSKMVMEHRQEEVKKLRANIWISSALVTLLFIFPSIIALITFVFYSAVFKLNLDPAKVFTGIALLSQMRIPIMMLPMVFSSAINARLGVKRIERLLDLEDTDSDSIEKPRAQKKSSSDDDEIQKGTSSSSTQTAPGFISIKNGEFEWIKVEKDLLKGTTKKGGLLNSCFPSRKKKERKNEITKKVALSPTLGSTQPTVAEEGTLKDGTFSNEIGDLQKATPVRVSVLRDINIEFSDGKLHAVVGHVGSGKSSLFHAILGEMRTINGDVVLDGVVAYVAQTAWIFHDTLRSNIIFGKDFNEELYNTAIKVSALEQDIAILPAGDLTSIGERGVNLSGGQKQRVSIARAVYAQADVYLFDDPLSALDAHVSQHVFDKCISNEGVLHDKLRILVTNQVHVLPQCDNVVFLDSGSIRGQGHYHQLLQSDDTFNSLVSEQEKAMKGEEEIEEVLDPDMTSGENLSQAKHAPGNNNFRKSSPTAMQAKASSKIMQDEERQTGKVGIKVYLDYIRAFGNPIFSTLLALLFIASTAISFVPQWWLSYWSQEATEGPNPRSTGFFLGIYLAITVVFALSSYIRSSLLLTMTIHAAKKLHNAMLTTIIHAPLTFFDTTPIGRILSRFSRDVSALDELLPLTFHQAVNTVSYLILTYAFIGFLLPPFIGVAVPIILLYVGVMMYFQRTIVELKRLDSISKSPIYAHFSETLGGLSTLRAYGKQETFRKTSIEKVDLNQRAFFMWIITNRLFTICLEIPSCFLIFAVAVFGVISRGQTFAGETGLALTYVMQATSFLGFTVRSVTELEGQMNSVERANYYIKNIPQEADIEIKGTTPESWPGKGEIEFENVELRYREELPLVLRGVNLMVRSGEKMGVVGRTGSGKSSMMIALLRMVEVCGGRILVDGVDLKTLGLDDIRSRITIIPQDPVMFSGTIRLNLDPFGQFSDAQLWDALEKSHMKQYVSTFEEGLDAPVSEYGENLSAGQKQIICLTRALLRQSKILILDEASSSLDIETDGLIQVTIREHLKNATILTIAHRLLTLADYDRIVVLDDGKVGQVGTPEELMNEDGLFKNLVESMGQSGAAHFRRKIANR